ncbi:MAG: hypothetical protein LBL27_04035 [Coriobacteriales bacterium]|jgi:hypothetical protein|nr:hypothetical protein [Coriobacteriales bacterium]
MTDDMPVQAPSEKIKDLLDNMIPLKRNFLSILEFCKEPKNYGQLDEFVAEMQSNRRTVYTAANYCQMLVAAEALLKITEDGTPFDEVSIEPVEVKRDGQVFVEPGTPPPAFWRTTEAGCRAIEDDKPIEALRNIFEKEIRYLGVFQQILELCDQEGGISIAEIKQVVNQDPVLEYPAKTAQFFMDYLDRNGALLWDKNWKITALGREALAFLHAKGGES